MARILIDTQVWLWTRTEPERLNEAVRSRLIDPGQVVLFSMASAIEVAIKYAIGKLPLPEPPRTFMPRRIAEDQLDLLHVELPHTFTLADLPMHHRDPFDRLLIAQAVAERIPIITADPVFGRYDVEVIAAT